MTMKRVTLKTLGVADLVRSRSYYARRAWLAKDGPLTLPEPE